LRAALDRFEAAVREIEAERKANRQAEEEAAQNEVFRPDPAQW
jgi:hypothetical protein